RCPSTCTGGPKGSAAGWSTRPTCSSPPPHTAWRTRSPAWSRALAATRTCGCPNWAPSTDDPAAVPARRRPAKQEVADLLDALGFDTVDLGILAESWRSEPNTPLFAQVYRGQPPPGLAGREPVAWVPADPG